MPSVAISSVVASWLTRWRSTKRSTATASTNMTSALTMKASTLASSMFSKPSHCGIHSENRAIDSAATSTMAPWAKLNTPEALKISTKPRPISAYSMPLIRPPNNVSRKNPMSVASVRHAEIGADDVFVGRTSSGEPSPIFLP